ncbi:MAG: efflux RND transporter periplasmic adaptor subunit [Saprospiraceae bacterium]|nr:efflux RND transporter periplasmic adaptor subunit [Saprospiraceae bacterium]
MNRVLKGVLTIVIIGVIAMIILYPKIGWPWEQEPAAEQAGPAAFGAPRALQVSGVVVQPERLVDRITVTGEVVPNEFLELKSEISGKIEGLFFDEGKPVRKGQLLVKINVDDLLAQREKLSYTKQLRETLELRQRQLLEREAISQEEYDQALAELQTSAADIVVLDTEIAKSEIRAPFDGVMGIRQVSPGAYITSSTIIAPLYSIQPAKVEFAVPAKYSAQVSTGSTITFTTEGVRDTFAGRVYALEPRIDPATRTLRIRALCANRSRLLLPGQFTRVNLVLSEQDSAIMVPTEAVIPELGGTKVFVLRQKRAAAVPVQTGVRTDTHLEITSGLSIGDTVLTSGTLQLRQGMEVNVNL